MVKLLRPLVLSIVASICGQHVLAEPSGKVVRVLVLNDQSGPNADTGGPGSVEAARLAIEDVGGRVAGVPIELLVADHQNKPDLAAAIARQFIDEKGVDVLVDVPVSSVSLAVAGIAKDKDKALLLANSGSPDLTGSACAPTTINWTWDTHMLAAGTAQGALSQGYKKWFFLTANYAFGIQMQSEVTKLVEASGGQIVGSVRHPAYVGADFSSFLLQAANTSADIIALSNGSADTINSIKQASEFGIAQSYGKHLAALLLYITDVHSIGLSDTQGLLLTDPFYWNQSPEARAWSLRYAERMKGKRPAFSHAGVYASLLHYFKAVEALGHDGGREVVARMKSMPTEDPLFGKGTIRPDGRKMHDAVVYKVKAPSASKEPWDYYEPVARITAEKAFGAMLPQCDFDHR